MSMTSSRTTPGRWGPERTWRGSWPLPTTVPITGPIGVTPFWIPRATAGISPSACVPEPLREQRSIAVAAVAGPCHKSRLLQFENAERGVHGKVFQRPHRGAGRVTAGAGTGRGAAGVCPPFLRTVRSPEPRHRRGYGGEV